jgi:hypothetical protein
MLLILLACDAGLEKGLVKLKDAAQYVMTSTSRKRKGLNPSR